MTKEPHRDSLPPGTGLLGEYRIERELGSDRFAVTYLAHEPGLDRQVVITEYLPPASSARRGDGTVGPRSDEHAEAFAAGLARFLEGARVLASVDHPGLGKGHRLHKKHKRRNALKEADVVLLSGVPNDFRLDYGSHVARARVISVNLSKHDLTKNRRP